MIVRRRGTGPAAAVGLVAGLVLLGAVVAGTAFACTPQARIVGVSPQAAPAGDRVTVKGEAFAGGRVVELHWGSVNGTVVGAAMANDKGEVLVEATVPESDPGVYTIVAVSPGQGLSRATFEVTGGLAGSSPPTVRRAGPSRPATAGGLAPAALIAIGAVVVLGIFAVAGVVVNDARRRRTAGAPVR